MPSFRWWTRCWLWTLKTALSSPRRTPCGRSVMPCPKKVGMLMGQAKKDPTKLAEADAAKAQVALRLTG